jgi:hypothetical protein
MLHHKFLQIAPTPIQLMSFTRDCKIYVATWNEVMVRQDAIAFEVADHAG